MLFGMFKEKEVIDSNNYNTKNDVVEDFGAMINNQNNDKDLISLSSFSGSHSEDINYQNIDLNNPQTIISSINNVPPQNVQFNNQTATNNYQPSNNGLNPNINNSEQQNQNMVQYGYNNINQNVPINNIQPTIPPINQQNSIGTQPIQPTYGVPNMGYQTQNIPLQNEFQSNIISNNIQNVPINNTQQINMTQDANNDTESKIDEEQVINSPVQILTEVPEKGGRTSLTSALLGNTQPQVSNVKLNTDPETQTPNIQQTNSVLPQTEDSVPNNLNSEIQTTLVSNQDIVQQPIPANNDQLVMTSSSIDENNTLKSIDDEIKNSPIPSMLPYIQNSKNMQATIEEQHVPSSLIPPTQNDDNTKEQNIIPASIDTGVIDDKNPSIIPSTIKTTENNENVEEKKENTNDNESHDEHKFIITDNVEVEPGFKICPKCGQKIRDDYRLCFVCGTYF